MINPELSEEEQFVESGQQQDLEHKKNSNQFNSKSPEKEFSNNLDHDVSLIEKTFEVIAPTSVTSIIPTKMDSRSSREDELDQTIKASPSENASSAIDQQILNKQRSNSGGQIYKENVVSQNKPKKSSSFLSKLQSSISDEKDNVSSPGNNLQASFTSAFSSFSTSISSSFNLNSSTNGDNNPSSLTIETASTSTRVSQVTETREDIFTRKAALERKNLISLTKLIVKDLISSSLNVSRTIEDCQNALHLNNYFTLIDRVLKHGLKQNLLSTRSTSLWNALDSLPKFLKESTLMSESIRSLANTKTPDGKIKAWIRLAMMQKKLPEYFNELLAQKNVLLRDIYHDYAFMLNDEAQVFAGLIIGVNVIDCNFFVKDANFDLMDDIIDLGPYLKAANSYDYEQNESNVSDHRLGQFGDNESMTAVLDQKNYLEEWNKRLEGTINGLQSKIKKLEGQNSKLEMELKVAEARIIKLQEKKQVDALTDKQSSNSATNNSSSFTDTLRSFIGTSTSDLKQSIDSSTTQVVDKELLSQKNADQNAQSLPTTCARTADTTCEGVTQQTSRPDNENAKESVARSELEAKRISEHKAHLAELEKELSALKERASILETSYRGALEKIKTLERDLDVQTSMNADKETTIKIYERDIRDKQSQVESLRASIGDAKKLNNDLSERLNETSAKMKERVKTISSLQDGLSKWKIENKTLANHLQDKQVALKAASSDLEKAMKTIEDLKKYNEKINEELKKERESGQSSSVTLETQTAKISELTAQLRQLEFQLEDVKSYREKTEELTQKCQDYEQSLSEIGTKLRESRLEVENLKENSAIFLDSQWMDSKQIKSCALCQQLFSVTRRKHHCRLCGNVFCQTCSDNKMELASSAKPVRVCDTCHEFLLAKFVKSSSSAT